MTQASPASFGVNLSNLRSKSQNEYMFELDVLGILRVDKYSSYGSTYQVTDILGRRDFVCIWR